MIFLNFVEISLKEELSNAIHTLKLNKMELNLKF